MPSPRFNFAAVVVHDSLFVIGGVDDQDNILNDIITYYPTEGVWKNKTNFPPQNQEGRHSLSAGVLNGKIITVGGGTGLLVTDIGSVDNLVRRYYP
jgi:N-acetylneuraminic acid mutarotase